jgi:hypothetical protein
LLFEPIDHGLRDQADAALSAPEALCVKIQILSYNQTLWNVHATVNDDFRQPGRSGDLNAGQYHCLLEIGVDVHTRTRVNRRSILFTRVNRIERRKTTPDTMQPPDRMQ